MLGVSQIDLAGMVGVSHTALTNIESGKSKPRAKTLAKIREALESQGAEFLDETATAGVGVRIEKKRRK
jgi:transcriptional regulator with XRE-family HTH domain